MNILIVGAGKVGEALIENLSKEKHDIIVVDEKIELVEKLVDTYDIIGTVGNGASYDVLINAKIQKADMLTASQLLAQRGYNIYATKGTSQYLTENGIKNTRVYWPTEEGTPQVIDLLREKKVDMVVNIPRDLSSREITNGYRVRRTAIDLNIPLLTNARLASSFIHAFATVNVDDLDIKSWDEY